MSDTPKLDFEERQRAQQVYEECCENPEDFAYNFVALQGELAAAQKRIAELERLAHDLAGAAWRLDRLQCLRTEHLPDDEEAEADHIIDVLRIAVEAARKEQK